MTGSETRSSDAPNGDVGSKSGYLYHKQPPEARPRHDGRSRRKPSRRKPSANAAHEAFLANVKTFSIVATCMALTLFLAMHVQRKSWQLKQQRSTRTVAAPAQRLTDVETANALQDDLTSPEQVADMDTEAMREAVLLTRQGAALEEAGDEIQAIAAYREALEQWPYLTEAWSKLGRLYIRRGEYSRAHRAMEHAVESDPSSAALLNDLGAVYLQQGRVDKAEEVFNTALDIDPEFALSYFNLALCYLAENQRDQAREYMGRYLAIHPDDARALREHAFLEASDGRYGEALELIEKAIAASPQWPPLFFDAAASAALMQDQARAIDFLEEAARLSSAAKVLRVLQQPAFSDLRKTAAGKDFAQSLSLQMREESAVEEPVELDRQRSEPITSMTSPQ